MGTDSDVKKPDRKPENPASKKPEKYLEIEILKNQFCSYTTLPYNNRYNDIMYVVVVVLRVYEIAQLKIRVIPGNFSRLENLT